jgi:hypothetical protein
VSFRADATCRKSWRNGRTVDREGQRPYAGPRETPSRRPPSSSIRSRVLLMPGRTDLYFPVADNADEIAHLAHAELRPIPSIWGHRAGAPQGNPPDVAFLRSAVRGWLPT